MTFNLPDFLEKDVVFVGKGKEGLSFEKFIKGQGNIKSFKFVDERDDPNYLESLKTLDLDQTIVVKTPGCPGNTMTVPYTTPTRVFFDCAKQLGSKTIGITGTKGKTTTTSLLHFALENSGADARLCGNVGLPMLEQLEGANEKTVFVVELSSFQLAELEQSPDIAIVTNLFKDHVDYHGGLNAYWEAKRNIVRFMDENGAVIYNPETEMVLHWLADSKAKAFPIEPKDDFNMASTKLIGDHNKLNILMVKKAADLLGIEHSVVLSSIAKFEPVRHRLQPVKTVRGVNFVDDAIGSTPEATVAGIKALIHNIGPIGSVMLGGDDRDYDFTELVALLYRVGIPKLIFFPDTGPIIKEMLPEKYTPETFDASNMEEAVKWAAENTPSGSICLLSTAAPSHVLWSSFEEKGSLFQQAVLELPS